MKALKASFREVAGLFVEDGSLALEIVAIVMLAGVFARLLPDSPSVAGGILLLGCLGVLGANVARAARRSLHCRFPGRRQLRYPLTGIARRIAANEPHRRPPACGKPRGA